MKPDTENFLQIYGLLYDDEKAILEEKQNEINAYSSKLNELLDNLPSESSVEYTEKLDEQKELMNDYDLKKKEAHQYYSECNDEYSPENYEMDLAQIKSDEMEDLIESFPAGVYILESKIENSENDMIETINSAVERNSRG